MSAPAVTSSAKLQQYFPDYGQTNADILLHILSFLSEKERVIVSRVCTTWREKVLPKLDVKAVKIKELILHGKLNDPPLSQFIGGDSDIIYASNNFLITYLNFSEHVKITAEIWTTKIKCTLGILYENEIILLCKSKDEKQIIGIDKKNGTDLFTTPIENKKVSTEFSHNNIVLCHVISDDPLVFFTLHYGGAVLKWEFKDQKIECTDYWFVEYENINFAFVYKDCLFINYCLNASKLEAYSLKNRQLINDSMTSLVKANYTLMPPFFGDIKKAGNRIFQLAFYESSDAYLASFDLETLEKWQSPQKAYTKFLIPPADKWVFLFLRETNWEVIILSSQNGQKINSFSFAPLSSFYLLDARPEIAAKLYGDKLFMACGKRILVYDLEKNNILIDTELQDDTTTHIQDFFLSRSKLYLLLNCEGVITLKSLECDRLKAHVKSIVSEEKIEELASLTEQIESFQEKRQTEVKSSQAKITAIALGVLTFLLVAGALAIYFKGAVNLSMGLGVSAAIAGSGTTAASIYHFKHREIQ